MLDSNLNVNAAIVDVDENALNNQTPKKRGENRVYEILKKFPEETDLVTGTRKKPILEPEPAKRTSLQGKREWLKN